MREGLARRRSGDAERPPRPLQAPSQAQHSAGGQAGSLRTARAAAWVVSSGLVCSGARLASPRRLALPRAPPPPPRRRGNASRLLIWSAHRAAQLGLGQPLGEGTRRCIQRPVKRHVPDGSRRAGAEVTRGQQ